MPLPEMIQTVTVAAATGWTAGSAAELFIQHRLASENRTLSEELGAAPSVQPSLARRLGNAVLGPVAAWSAVTAGVGALAWLPHETTTTEQPSLTIVADLSGATANGEQEPLKRVHAITDAFAKNEDLKTKTFAARGGEFIEIPTAEVDEVAPTGDVPLEQATLTALDDSSELRRKALATAAAKGVGVLVLSNGNAVNSARVVPEAKIEGIRVWGVNVANDPAARPGDLKVVAEETGGVSWDAKSVKPEQIVEEITNTLQSTETPTDERKQNRILQVLSAGMLGYVPIMYRWRRRMSPLQSSLLEENRS